MLVVLPVSVLISRLCSVNRHLQLVLRIDSFSFLLVSLWGMQL